MISLDLPNVAVIAAAFGVFVIGFLSSWLRKDVPKERPESRKPDDLITRLRKVLDANLGRTLGAIRPEDELDRDIGLQLNANPELFWQLDEEFGISTDYDKLEVFEKTTERLVTFADLVEYVEAKIVTRASAGPGPVAEVPLADKIFDRLTDVLPPACIAGLAFAVLGSMLGFESAWRVGSGIFMLGVVLLVIAFFNVGIDNLTTEIRKEGMSWVRDHRLRTAWIAFIVGAIIYMSFAMLRGVLKLIVGAS